MSRPTDQEYGYLALVLHAHLPFVRHPENRHHLEELWLFEAITDTYLPLLDLMEGWVRDQIPFRLTMSVTPPLASMLADPLLKNRYVQHLERSIALAHREMVRTASDPGLAPLARMYRDRFVQARQSFLHRHNGDLLASFRRFTEYGLELIASAATHALLPLTAPYPRAPGPRLKPASSITAGSSDSNLQVFGCPNAATPLSWTGCFGTRESATPSPTPRPPPRHSPAQVCYVCSGIHA